MRPVLFELPMYGGLPIHSYGLMIALGFLAAIYLSMWRAKKVGILPRHVMNCGLLALLGGVLGARLGFIIEKWEEVRHWDFWHMINIREGGLTVTGGVPLAMGLIMLYLWLKKIRIHRFLDVIGPAVAIGLTFGRIGCLLNGCCYGKVSDRPWSIRFPAGSPAYVRQLGKHELADSHSHPLLRGQMNHGPVDYRELPHHAGRVAQRILGARGGTRLPEHWAELDELKPYYVEGGAKRHLDEGAVAAELHRRLEALAWNPQYMCRPVHPTQVYQQLAGLAMFGLLSLHWLRRRHEGQIAAAFVVLYGVQRLTVEFFRDTSDPVLWNMNPFQWCMAGAAIAGVLWYVLVTTRTPPVDRQALAADVAKMEAALTAAREARETKAAGQARAAAKPHRGKRRRRR